MYTFCETCYKCNGLGFEQESGATCSYCLGKGYVETILKRKHIRAMFPSVRELRRAARKRRETQTHHGAKV